MAPGRARRSVAAPRAGSRPRPSQVPSEAWKPGISRIASCDRGRGSRRRRCCGEDVRSRGRSPDRRRRRRPRRARRRSSRRRGLAHQHRLRPRPRRSGGGRPSSTLTASSPGPRSPSERAPLCPDAGAADRPRRLACPAPPARAAALDRRPPPRAPLPPEAACTRRSAGIPPPAATVPAGSARRPCLRLRPRRRSPGPAAPGAAHTGADPAPSSWRDHRDNEQPGADGDATRRRVPAGHRLRSNPGASFRVAHPSGTSRCEQDADREVAVGGAARDRHEPTSAAMASVWKADAVADQHAVEVFGLARRGRRRRTRSRPAA